MAKHSKPDEEDILAIGLALLLEHSLNTGRYGKISYQQSKLTLRNKSKKNFEPNKKNNS